jgi:glutathione S-transferase
MLGSSMTAPRPKLYALPASHPCAAVEAALDLKRIAYDRVDLLPMTQLAIGPLRYGGMTVPGMRLGSERLVGSRAIMRRLDELVAQPPLLPAPGDPRRERVLEIERWGDDVFQSVARRIVDAAFMRSPQAMESYAAGAKLPLPTTWLRPAMPLTARLMGLRNRATDDAARADIAALPGQLAQIDAWISEGLLGAEQPNAADLQIGSTIRLLRSVGDVTAIVDAHPAARLARYFPPLAGHVEPGALPNAWLPAITVA